MGISISKVRQTPIYVCPGANYPLPPSVTNAIISSFADILGVDPADITLIQVPPSAAVDTGATGKRRLLAPSVSACIYFCLLLSSSAEVWH